MRSLLNYALRGLVSGAAFMAIIGLVGVSYASIPIFVGPGQTGGIVANQPNMIADLNALVSQINTSLGALTFNNSPSEVGEIAINSATAWAANGTTATTMTSLGPLNAHTTVQEWLVFMDPSGNQRFVPAY